MHESASPLAALLYWALAAAVQWLGLHVTLASVREAHRSLVRPANGAAAPGRTAAGPPRANASARWLLLQAALAMGTALSASMVLGVAGQGPAYVVGYAALAAAWLWVMAVLLALPLLALLAWRRSPAAMATAAFGLAAAAAGLDAGWLMSAGLEPGLRWQPQTLAVALLVMALGLGLAFHIAYRGPGRTGTDRRRWRAAAAGIAAAALLLGERLVMLASGLSLQVSSGHAEDLPASALNVIAAICAPLLLLLMLLLLLVRRQRRPRRGAAAAASATSGLSTINDTLLELPPAPERRPHVSGRGRGRRRRNPA